MVVRVSLVQLATPRRRRLLRLVLLLKLQRRLKLLLLPRETAAVAVVQP